MTDRDDSFQQPPLDQIECMVPPSPELEERIRATQTALRRGAAIPANDKRYLDLQDFLVIKSRPPVTRAATLVRKSIAKAPAIGTRKALVVLVDFPDLAAVETQQHYRDVLFSSGTYATGSMRDFYWEASYGKLVVTGEIAGQGVTTGWFRAPQPKTFYTNGNNGFGAYPNNAQRLVEDVIDQAAGLVNFADYDNDGDGIVDALVIIAAGSGAEVTGNPDDIWSHKWAIAPRSIDGVDITGYFMAPEDGRVGVMAHELGHLLLGAPDLYDTDYSSRGTGRWDLMAAGSWNNNGDTPAQPSAWVKTQVGWVNPIVLTSGSHDVVIPPYANNEQVYKLPIGAADSKEYFLVSNRQQVGFDTHLPGAGCLIEHCDDNQSNNTDENHYLVDVEQCDGRFDLNKNANAGDDGDPFPGAASSGAFTESTTPNSNAYSGAASNISLTDIQRSGSNITAKISVGGGVSAGWLYNQSVLATFASHHSQNAWALIDGVGWRSIQSLSTDGVANLFGMMCEAMANSLPVHVYIDADAISIAYLV